MTRFDFQAHGGDVQAIVRTGFRPLPHCRYLLLGIVDRSGAASWIERLLQDERIKSVADTKGKDFDEAVQVAFTHRGLAGGLQLAPTPDLPFPTIFEHGMAAPERAALLGDDPRAAWQWNDAHRKGQTVHLLVAHFRKDSAPGTRLLDPAVIEAHGLAAIKTIETCPQYIARKDEPFGFQDGISQPSVPGLHGKGGEDARDGSPEEERKERKRRTGRKGEAADPDALAPGELLLHQLNEYGERAYCPDIDGFAAFSSGRRFAENGSYLAVRQIRQDVAALHAWDPKLAHASAGDEPTPFERIIGRRKDGTPLRACPVLDDRQDVNAFLFRVDDYEGFHCPRGAHIRRGNPRDALGWDSASGVFASKLHRILRRGRVYRDAAACTPPGSACSEVPGARCGQGLFFIALNADLERQFEFVQRHWLGNPKFADLFDERDALGGGDFSMPGYMPVGNRLTGVPPFTEVIGGGYFFLPSLTALRFIAKRGRP